MTDGIISNKKIQIVERSIAMPKGKHYAFLDRPIVDTAICGDSRVGRIMPNALLKRGWAPFNWALPGMVPADTALQVAHSLHYGKIRRLIIGISFEAMASKNALYGRYFLDFPFTNPKIKQIFALNQSRSNDATIDLRQIIRDIVNATKRSLVRFWGAKHLVEARITYLYYNYIIRKDFSKLVAINQYGNYLYRKRQTKINNGTFDFDKSRDPTGYFNRDDSEVTYLKNKVLSKEALEIYSTMFQELRLRKIPTIIFETGRLKSYQQLIDQTPILKSLHGQWREFFRKESHGTIKFIEAKEIMPYYYFEDFFDAVHFFGEKTEKQLSEKLASELEELEKSVIDNPNSPD